jgi:hypothetical protein
MTNLFRNRRIQKKSIFSVKTFLLLFTLIFLSCNKVDKTNNGFEIFGEDALLKNIKVNSIKNREDGAEKKQTLLFNRKQFSVQEENETAYFYRIYLSYKDSLVSVLEYENILRGDKNQINQIYLFKEQDSISFKFIGSKEFLPDIDNRPAEHFITLEEYFQQKNINTIEEKSKAKELFFDFYE